MIDANGRSIEYLRLSVTERCTLRCTYCRADEGDCPKQKELSAEQLLRIVRVMASLGINKVRLTGGEPLLRRDLVELIRNMFSLPDIREITLTTNGQQLAERAAELRQAGLNRINISLDSLDSDKYRELTGGGSLQKVLDGIDAALAAGLQPIKLNAVLMRGKNDDEIDDFMALAKDRPIDMRFIELMPLGNTDQSAQRITADEIIAARPQLIALPPRYPGQPSADYTLPGYLGRIGFIAPISHSFCSDCNRVRVMSDGMLRPCLGNNAEISLCQALADADDQQLTEVIREAIWHKPLGHSFDDCFHAVKNMSKIGG